MTHTPAPWYIAEMFAVHGFTDNDGGVPIMSGEAEDVKRVGTALLTKHVKRGQTYQAKDAERDANAALMSAAPDLLAAFKRFQTFARDNGWTDADYHDSDGTGWISAMNAAIAKAEGRKIE